MTFEELKRNLTRRHFFAQGAHLLGTASLATLLSDRLLADGNRADSAGPNSGMVPTHFAPERRM